MTASQGPHSNHLRGRSNPSLGVLAAVSPINSTNYCFTLSTSLFPENSEHGVICQPWIRINFFGFHVCA